MAAPVVLALTLLFVGDDPRSPSVVVALQEGAAGRVADVVVFPNAPGSSPLVVHLLAPPLEGAATLRSLPIAPPGAAVAEVVDGVLVTVDDVGAWVPPAPPSAEATTSKAKRARGTPLAALPSMESPPTLPVASAATLRLFVPSVVPGRPQPASLHGVVDGALVVFTGQALASDGGRRTSALSIADVVDGGRSVHVFDGSVPVVVGDVVSRCASSPAAPSTSTAGAGPLRALQRLTQLEIADAACAGALVAAAGTGLRLAEEPQRDAPARGLVVQWR